MIEYVDRYNALGIPQPDPMTMCLDQCEGTGWVPCRQDDEDPTYREAWAKQHKEAHTLKAILPTAWKYKDVKWLWRGFKCDGWHFIKCPSCKGTGKRPEEPTT